MPPQGAPAQGRPKGADAPIHQSREAHHTLAPADLAPYGRLRGWVLTRAHARSGDAAAISGYLGGGDRFDRAVADFAEAYADQTEADHAAFRRARG